MTENNYVIKDLSKHEILNQCWDDIGPAAQALGQHQPSIGSMSRVCRDGLYQAGEGPQQRRDIEQLLVECWPIVNDAVPTLKQHKGNVTCLRGGGGVLMVPIAVLLYSQMRGERPHCVNTPKPNPPPPTTTCYSSHLLCKGSICSLVKSKSLTAGFPIYHLLAC